MNLRFEKWGVRVHFGITRTALVRGVNSTLKDGNHFLMWDFDSIPLPEVEEALLFVQRYFLLPDIYILCTGIEGYYHAYCFSRCSWQGARTIISSTDGIDRVFFMMGIMRGYFTLRFSKKKGREFNQVSVLRSQHQEDVRPEDAESFVEYTTKNR